MKTIILILLFSFPLLSHELDEREILLKTSHSVKWEINLSDEDWIPMQIPSNVYDYVHFSQDKIWIRCRFEYPFAETDQMSLFLGAISDRDRTYLNGQILGGFGEFNSPLPQAYDRERLYPIPAGVLQKGENVLLIQIERYFPYEAGILDSIPVLGYTPSLYSKVTSRNYREVFFLAIYMIAGLYFLFLFLRRKKDSSNLLFSLSSFGVVVYQFLRNQLKYELGIPFLEMKRWEYISLCLSVPFYCNFAYSYFGLERRDIHSINWKISSHYKWVFWFNENWNVLRVYFFKNPLLNTLNLLSLICVVLYLASDSVIYFDTINKNIMQPVFFIYCFSVLYFLFHKANQKNQDAMLMLIATGILVGSVFTDILSDRGYFVLPRTVSFFFLAFEISIALILANKTVRLHNQVEELNQNLEQKVEERTNELNTSLREIGELKLQQDADYFLTTLLIEPLIRNDNQSENVKSEFFLSQKKKFDFRKKTFEIGGDINICGNLSLDGKKFTVFINGDAMGKSIQGAGGALVFGVIFRSILARSNVRSFKGIYPEQWLRDAFLELQNAFESFNGSMYISLAMGLIEDKTGLLYYINAEHPKTVLLRNGRAGFLENEQIIRKLGIPGNEEIFKVLTFSLQHGDILLAGSDGRDDLLMGELDGVKIYNEDEYLFLKKVEESRGDIDKLTKLVTNTGQVTDDFSLLKIEYKNPEIRKKKTVFSNMLKNLYSKEEVGEEQSITERVNIMKALYKIMPSNELANYTLGLYYYRRKQYDKALKHTLLYNERKPDSIPMLLLAAKLFLLLENFSEGKKVLEQLKLREPENRKLRILNEEYEKHWTEKKSPNSEITVVPFVLSRNGSY
jgi:hypothetical protein